MFDLIINIATFFLIPFILMPSFVLGALLMVGAIDQHFHGGRQARKRAVGLHSSARPEINEQFHQK